MIEMYSLSCPLTGEIRYIGKANDSEKRFKSHLNDCKRRNTPVYCWIRSLLKINKLPIMQVICISISDHWQKLEKDLIAQYRKEKNKLLNVADGGDEPYCDTTTRKSNAKKLNERIQNDPRLKLIRQHKQRLADSLRRGYVSEKTKNKMRSRPDVFGSLFNLM